MIPMFRQRNVEVRIGRCLKYLDLWFDGKRSFREHIRKVADKANRKLGMLGELITKLRGPKEVVPQKCANVTLFILLYDALVWADVAKVIYRRTKMKILREGSG